MQSWQNNYPIRFVLTRIEVYVNEINEIKYIEQNKIKIFAVVISLLPELILFLVKIDLP